jgi:SM-20-related protein
MNVSFDAIADGLAEQGYAVADQFLNEQEVKAVLQQGDFNDARQRFKKAGIGQQQDAQINEAIRGDYIHWLDPKTASAPVKVYLDRLDELVKFLNRALFLSLKSAEVHLTVYPAGTYYKRHLDQFKKDDHRKLSVICYLNEDWLPAHGGQLRMHLPDGEQEFLPLAGRLVCFRSDQIEHEVVAATRERLSITGWILDREIPQ